MVGCDKCDGTNNHYGHGNQRFLYKGMGPSDLRKHNITIDPWDPPVGDMVLDPRSTKKLDIKPNWLGLGLGLGLGLRGGFSMRVWYWFLECG